LGRSKEAEDAPEQPLDRVARVSDCGCLGVLVPHGKTIIGLPNSPLGELKGCATRELITLREPIEMGPANCVERTRGEEALQAA